MVHEVEDILESRFATSGDDLADFGGAIQEQVDAWLEGDRVGADTIAAGAVPWIKGFLMGVRDLEVVDADWGYLGLDD